MKNIKNNENFQNLYNEYRIRDQLLLSEYVSMKKYLFKVFQISKVKVIQITVKKFYIYICYKKKY